VEDDSLAVDGEDGDSDGDGVRPEGGAGTEIVDGGSDGNDG
jgi:hypothetical protein